jgi:SAM-dependent methyltransferase
MGKGSHSHFFEMTDFSSPVPPSLTLSGAPLEVQSHTAQIQACSCSDRACYLCGSPYWKEVVTLDRRVGDGTKHYTVYRCRGCSLEFLWPLLSDKSCVALYDSTYYKEGYLAHEAERTRHFDGLLEKMSAAGIQGPILDVGCGTGMLTSLVRQRGFEVYGAEPSGAGRTIARQRYGLEVAASLSHFAGKRFRTAVFWMVLGAVADPRALLRSVSNLLENSGRVIMSFNNWSDPRFRVAMLEARFRNLNTIHVPTIIWRFREQHLKALATQAGLTIDRFLYERRPIRLETGLKRKLLETGFAIQRFWNHTDEELHAWCRKA